MVALSLNNPMSIPKFSVFDCSHCSSLLGNTVFIGALVGLSIMGMFGLWMVSLYDYNVWNALEIGFAKQSSTINTRLSHEYSPVVENISKSITDYCVNYTNSSMEDWERDFNSIWYSRLLRCRVKEARVYINSNFEH